VCTEIILVDNSNELKPFLKVKRRKTMNVVMINKNNAVSTVVVISHCVRYVELIVNVCSKRRSQAILSYSIGIRV
jgi:hypothetical protein